MAARVDLELGRELGVSAAVVQGMASEFLREGEHVEWIDCPGGQRRKVYTEAGLAILRHLLAGGVEKTVEKAGEISLPGAGFTIWAKNAEKTPSDGGASAIPHPAAEKPAAEKPAGDVQRPAVSLLLIVRICPNPIWVIVQTPDKRTAEVRVRHSRLLVAGKRVRCAPTADGRWECADPLLALNPIWR